MDQFSELIPILSKFLNWNKARVDCFSRMLLALFAVRTVNLHEIALAFCSEALVDSRYKRIHRFFAYFHLDYIALARWVFSLFIADKEKIYLIIDRTNWQWGKQKINVFMLAVAYEGLAIPLFWDLLNKGGSASYEEQKALLKKFMHTFGRLKIAGLLADREFMNGQLMGWLNKQKIPFYVRIKEKTQVTVRGKKWCTAKKLFNHLSPKTKTVFAMSVFILNEKVYLAGSRSERGELMIVATNQNPGNAISIYCRRWEIENLFQGLKSRGFCFEATHITETERIKKLLVLLTVGFCWAHKIGEWRATKKPIVFKQFRRQKRPQYSYFRYGLDYLREIILQGLTSALALKPCFKLLLPSKTFHITYVEVTG